MYLPIIQLVIGVGVGLLGLLMLHTYQSNNYNTANGHHQHAYDDDDRGASSSSYYYDEDRRRRQRSLAGSRSGDQCVICLVDMMTENMHYLQCGHALHKECFENCKKHSDKCPLCREKV